MKLTTGTGVKIEDPTPEQIRAVLSDLPTGGDNFAIYERDGRSYVQVVGCAADGFLTEYQLGTTNLHYRAVDTAVPLDEVMAIMTSFAADDDRYLTMQGWELDETLSSRGRGCAGPAAATLMLLVGALAILTCR